MKTHILLVVLIVTAIKVESISAQPPHCSTIVNTQTTYDPTNSNFWDWKNPVWPTNIYSTLAFVGVARKQRAGLTNKRINLNYWIANGGKKYGLKRR